MDKSIPAPAARLLEFISSIEAPRGYETIYGNNQSKLPKPITKMTLDEVQKAQPTWTKRFGSSAAGAYQIMRDTMDSPKTMADLEGEMGLSGSELFDADMQDRMAFHLLNRRGYADFMAGKIGIVAFAKRLAQEWASFPVLAATKGAHRQVSRGQSYYAGDGVNKALVSPEKIETLLADIKRSDSANLSTEPAQITDRDTVIKVQTELKALGYNEVGEIDGKVGRMTRTAILAFRNENDLPTVNYIDAGMLAALWTAKPRELSHARVEAKPSEVREHVPEAKAAWWTQIGAWVMGVPAAIGAVVSGVLDNLDGARGYLEPVKNFAGDIPPWVWFAVVGGAALFIWQKSRQAQTASVEAFKSGERR